MYDFIYEMRVRRVGSMFVSIESPEGHSSMAGMSGDPANALTTRTTVQGDATGMLHLHDVIELIYRHIFDDFIKQLIENIKQINVIISK